MLAAAAPQPSPPSPPFVAPTWQRRFSVAASATHIIVATGDGRVVTWGADADRSDGSPVSFMRRSLADTDGSTRSGRSLTQLSGKSYNFSDLACIPGALMPVPLGPAVPAVEGATSACADQAAADGRTLFAMKPSNTTGSFDCFGAANANATSADILAAAATYAPLSYGDCDTPCFGPGTQGPVCGKGDNAFLFDVLITSGTDGGASGPYIRATATSPAALAGPEGLDPLFEGSADDASTPITVPFPFLLGNVRVGMRRRPRPR